MSSLLSDEEYARLSPPAKLKYMRALIRGAREVFAESYEQNLVPKIAFKPAEPEPADTEDRVRQFFIENPDVDEVKVGDVIYKR